VKSPRRVLDSSVWLELLRRGPLEKNCRHELEEAGTVLVPTLVIFEVYRKLLQSLSEDQALSAIALLSQYEVRELTREVALLAGDLSVQHQLAMADSLVLAHAQEAQATLLTLDNDFAKLPGAKVLRRR